MTGSADGTQGIAAFLASKGLPKRVRMLLEGLYAIALPAYERIIEASLDELQQEFFQLAEKSSSSDEEIHWLEARKLVSRKRGELMPRLSLALGIELATSRDPSPDQHAGDSGPGIGMVPAMSLASKQDADESAVVGQLSNRVEMRNNLPLYLLGQRLGVLAEKPGLMSEHIPLGPHAFCRMLRQASACLDLSTQHRQLMFKVTERHMMMAFTDLIANANSFLARNSILPDFEYMPTRARQKSAEPAGLKGVLASASEQDHGMAESGQPARVESRQFADLPAHFESLHDEDVDLEGEASFLLMRELLATRKQLLAKLKPAKPGPAITTQAIPAALLQDALRVLQGQAPEQLMASGKPIPRTIQHLKQELLARVQVESGDEAMAVLDDEDDDVIELVDMLFDSIRRETNLDSLASQLLEKLQVPLLRVALLDRGFFYESKHPAKQLLDAIAESGAYWLGDSDSDPALLGKMNAVVDRTVHEFDGDMALFGQLSQDINSHLQLLTHKAEVAERRHVEAARGKEKLSHARTRAIVAITDLLADVPLPEFTKAVLKEAWTDVLALTALRHDEGESEWKHQVEVAERLIQSAQALPGKPLLSDDAARGLAKEMEVSLMQVGYESDEIEAIRQRLIRSHAGQGDAAASAEFVRKLESRIHFGVDPKAPKDVEAPLTAEEKSHFDRLRNVAFGTWFAFVTNQQGDVVRQRLSWFSTTTGHTLFVNKRGQKVGEYHMAALARRMARGELSVVEEKSRGIIDRAWRSIMDGLKSFAGRHERGETA